MLFSHLFYKWLYETKRVSLWYTGRGCRLYDYGWVKKKTKLVFDSPAENEIFKLELIDFLKTNYNFCLNFQKKTKTVMKMYNLVEV